jgi:hypothetical protein
MHRGGNMCAIIYIQYSTVQYYGADGSLFKLDDPSRSSLLLGDVCIHQSCVRTLRYRVLGDGVGWYGGVEVVRGRKRGEGGGGITGVGRQVVC